MYKGRNIGRILDFLREYGIFRRDQLMFHDDGAIFLFDKIFATYSWEEGTDVPIFYFANNCNYSRAQDTHRDDVVEILGEHEICLNCNFEQAIVRDSLCDFCLSDRKFENALKASIKEYTKK